MAIRASEVRPGAILRVKDQALHTYNESYQRVGLLRVGRVFHVIDRDLQYVYVKLSAEKTTRLYGAEVTKYCEKALPKPKRKGPKPPTAWERILEDKNE